MNELRDKWNKITESDIVMLELTLIFLIFQEPKFIRHMPNSLREIPD
ncbi:hypothetical protein Nhal_3482 [Nitrosococcus halophilus Nc 4]|uniref:Uncharacterized protein n=1 Tax=Nitrosococcus halophilus (strain Nc4) TaxID=472759 RepID=D5C1F5_NITHN|nr:hypothetical protein Nhal_3482 [Nitrosococcus halophilus Nc 4]